MMKRLLLLTCVLALSALGVSAQATTQIIDDAEPGSTRAWSPFGGAAAPTVIANPDASGSNLTANVLQWQNNDGADFFAGASSDSVPGGIDLTNLDPAATLSLQIWVPDTAPDTVAVLLKLEDPNTGGPVDYIDTVFNDQRNQWVTITYDPFATDRVGAPAAAGRTFGFVSLFVDFTNVPAAAKTKADVYFVDEIKLEGIASPVQTSSEIIHDLETPATTIAWTEFEGAAAPMTIPNPDMSALNMTDSVEQWENNVGTAAFGGAFGDPAGGVDLTNLDPNQGSITYLVWVPDTAPDTVAVQFKLENPGANAIEYRDTIFSDPSERNQWVQVEVDPFANGVNGEPPAAGQSWSRVVFFFDFTVNPNRDKTKNDIYFLDEIKVNGILPPDSVDVTFAVDMNEVTDAFNTVYVSGTFNGFAGTASPLDDADGDGVWTGTYKMEEGVLEYKFQADDYAVDEIFDGTEVCTQRDPSGNFVNRVAQISSDTTLAEVAFGSCYAAGEAISITINLGFQDDDSASTEGVFLAGGAGFGAAPNEFRLTDDDGDGVYSITFERATGFEDFFTFTNGACPDYSCKEDIAGQACADPDNFNDRKFDTLTTDTVINTCFAVCSDNTDCTTSNIRNFDQELFTVQPTLVTRFAELSFPNAQPKQVRVLNLNGQVLQSEPVQAAAHRLDFSSLPAGLYLIQVQANDRLATRKILKQ